MPRDFSKINRVSNGKRRGVVMVELAFVITILLSLTLGLIQWGMIMNSSLALTNLSREGARYAAVNWNGDTDQAIKDYVLKDAPPNIKPGDLTVTVSPALGTADRQAKMVSICAPVRHAT